MDIGIVGLPNVGKSTLFNALTGAAAAASNFPFTTIDPNVGIVPLPDERLTVLGKMFDSEKVTPGGIKFIDIAGIVKGASQGEGLGNKFLSHIRAVDAIAHVVRCFNDPEVINVLGSLNPGEAADIIETELLLSDLQQAEKALDKLQGPARSGDKKAREKLEQMENLLKGFREGRSARSQNVPAEVQLEQGFLTGKPVLYVANTDENRAGPKTVGRAGSARQGGERCGGHPVREDGGGNCSTAPGRARLLLRSRRDSDAGVGAVGDGRQRPVGAHFFFYGRASRDTGLGDPPRHAGGEGCGKNPFGH
jgi:ribosome-binding ATPase YchF (GTP1/OBG family)